MTRIALSLMLGLMVVTVQAAPVNPLIGGQRNHQVPANGQAPNGQQVAPPPGGEPPATVPAGGSPSSEDLALLKKGKKGAVSDDDGYPEALKSVLNTLRVSAMVDDTVALRYVVAQTSSSTSGTPAPTPVGSTGGAASATAKQKEQSLIVRGGQTISMGGVLLKVMVSNDGIVITDNNNKIAFAGQVDTTDLAPQDIIKSELVVEDAKIKDGLATGASTTVTSASTTTGTK